MAAREAGLEQHAPRDAERDELTELRLSALVYGDIVGRLRAVGRRGHGSNRALFRRR
jgi:hypothetical protein